MSSQIVRATLISSTLAASWLGMQIVHELGHVLAAWLTGGRVVGVVLHPLALSRTDVFPNPQPLIVVWGGPVTGAGLPLVSFLIARRLAPATAYLPRFFAGFCCVANGGYLGAGAVYPVGDAAAMLAEGVSAWVLVLFGAITVPLGFALWDGLGPNSGLGPHAKPVSARHALGMGVVFIGVTLVEIAFA